MLDIQRARVRLGVVPEGDLALPDMEALFEQLGTGACDWSEPRIPDLLSWVRSGKRRSELQALLRSTASSMHTLTTAHARQLIELLNDFQLTSVAYALSALPQLARDPEVATLRARLAMQLRDYPAAIAASELAISALLQPGVSIDELLRLCVAGAPAEGMLRFERHVLADRAHLSERLALRWEALHRAGQSRDAQLMQLMCQRYFPERASVWATAGNHALDGDDLSAAEKYFERCLKLDHDWTAALAGLAIVHERRKDWAAALPYRRRALEVERALERDDAPNLHRRIRYAAALARLGRWSEAEPLFRSATRSADIAQLPAEHPVLLRVFSQDLYAPALVSTLLDHGSKRIVQPRAAARAVTAPVEHEDTPGGVEVRPAQDSRASHAGDATQPAAASQADNEVLPPGTAAQRAAALPEVSREPAVALAQHEAGLLEQLRMQLQAASSETTEQRWTLGLCAYLSGELERAFELFDHVEDERPDDLAVHYLLWRCASALGHEQASSIRAFAEAAARALWAEREHSEASLAQLGYAVAILPELAPQVRAAGYALPADTLEELEPIEAPLLAQLERLAAFRATHQAAGHSPLVAAAASTHALAALAATHRS